MLSLSRDFLIVCSDHVLAIFGRVQSRLIGQTAQISHLVLSDDVCLALTINHSAHIRWQVSTCPRCGKPAGSLKTIRS